MALVIIAIFHMEQRPLCILNMLLNSHANLFQKQLKQLFSVSFLSLEHMHTTVLFGCRPLFVLLLLLFLDFFYLFCWAVSMASFLYRTFAYIHLFSLLCFYVSCCIHLYLYLGFMGLPHFIMIDSLYRLG